MKIAISEMKGAAFLFLVLTCLSLYVKSVSCAAYIGRSPGYYDAAIEGQNPEYVLQTLARIRQELLREDLENTKRGLDLGLGRGFSGTQQAKHLMGLAAAQFAGGPGRRRRSNDDDENQN